MLQNAIPGVGRGVERGQTPTAQIAGLPFLGGGQVRGELGGNGETPTPALSFDRLRTPPRAGGGG